MKYLITSEMRQFLIDTHGMLNQISVKGGSDVSLMFGSLSRIEECIKTMEEIPDKLPEKLENKGEEKKGE